MSVAEQLNSKGATPETVLQILTSSVFEASGDLTPEEMRSELRRAVSEPDALEDALQQLQADPDLVGDIALLWISDASENPAHKGTIEGAIDGADRQLPLLETGLIVLVALYALYLMGPDKPLRTKKVLKHRSDGSFEEHEETSYASFEEPIRGLLGLFNSKGASD